MIKKEKPNIYGLLGKNISYSFSANFFSKKFLNENIENSEYVNFDLQNIQDFKKLIQENDNLKGMNVTIPYKEDVIPYLNILDKTAEKIGAVNTIKFTKRGNLKGYNTDVVGFAESIKPLLKRHHKKALILGTGGASKAVAYVFKKNDIKFKYVSRKPKGKKQISYDSLNEEMMNDFSIIVNCTPLGTFPNVEAFPNIPYQYITEKHLLFDLIYNPEITQFLAKGKEKGAVIKNGYDMLVLQAEASWNIWNS